MQNIKRVKHQLRHSKLEIERPKLPLISTDYDK